MNLRNIEPSEQRTFGTSNLRNNGPSEHRTFGTTDLRNNGPSEKRAVPDLYGSIPSSHVHAPNFLAGEPCFENPKPPRMRIGTVPPPGMPLVEVTPHLSPISSTDNTQRIDTPPQTSRLIGLGIKSSALPSGSDNDEVPLYLGTVPAPDLAMDIEFRCNDLAFSVFYYIDTAVESITATCIRDIFNQKRPGDRDP